MFISSTRDKTISIISINGEIYFYLAILYGDGKIALIYELYLNCLI